MGRPRTKVEQGNKYNHLTAIEFVGITDKGHQMWIFECDCKDKARIVTRASYVVSGHTKSCGCEKLVGHHKKHNMSNTRLYNIYYNMIARCYNENDKSYKDYGAKGTIVCDEWKTGFDSFAEWSLKNGYAEGLTIDRIDNSKGYSPDNCRWVSCKIQQNNRTNNHRLTFNGETHTLSEWETITGISQDNIYARLKLGWSVEKTLTEKIKTMRRKEECAV